MIEKKTKFLIILILGLAPMLASAATSNDESEVLKQQFFPGKSIQEGSGIIEIDAPYRAEDPALVPIRIRSKIPQTPERYIRKITVLIDQNPVPFAADFEFSPDSGRADLAMRVRINSYSYVRAIAETSDGKLYMHKKFVKAIGGCSAPIWMPRWRAWGR